MKRYALVFEDEDSIRKLVNGVLMQHGYHTRTYATPAAISGDAQKNQTRERGRYHEPDVIVSDNRMPRLSGLEYVRNLRKSGRKIRHIALMSGDWHPEEQLEAESLGCKVFSKPFPLSDLSDWLQSIPAE